MDIQQLILLCIAGTLAGFIAGGMGVGGGIIIVPALVFLFGFTQHEAQGTSLAVLLPPISIFAVIKYHQSGYINYKYAAILALTFFLGSYLGGILAVKLPARTLTKLFGVLMLIAGAKMFFSR
ncbi:MAG: sulfite exporter TauE/SafE family protein [Bacteroidales bacterium]|nr:sulfite exporter TauE/SafE family protein [Bacteroidales bacterium]